MYQSLLSIVGAAQAKCGAGSVFCDTGLPTVGAETSELQTILQIVFAILAAVAVLVVILGGLRFITSQGNPQETTKARDTIIYAGIGLVVALLAGAIVSFVLKGL